MLVSDKQFLKESAYLCLIPSAESSLPSSRPLVLLLKRLHENVLSPSSEDSSFPLTSSFFSVFPSFHTSSIIMAGSVSVADPVAGQCLGEE